MKTRKHIVLIMTLLMLCVLTNAMTTLTEAASGSYLTLAELQAKYPDGSKWYGTFDGSIQCAGFARLLCYEAYGSEYYLNNADGKWIKYTDSSYIDNGLKSGDLVRYNYNGHSVWIVAVNGESVSIADCNSDWACTVRWRTVTKASLKNGFTHAYSAPYAFDGGTNRVALYETATVTAKSGLTIRQAPDINAAKAGCLNSGASIQVCYYPITDASGYTWRRLLDGRGWVCENYLQITGGQSLVSGTYKLQNANGKYLSYTSTPTNNTNIVMYDDLADTSLAALQLWNFQPLHYNNTGAILYRITPAQNANYSLDCDATNNELLHLWQSLDIKAQQWIVELRTDGSLRILNAGTNLALDVKNASNDNNAEVITYTSNDTNAQTFYLVAP